MSIHVPNDVRTFSRERAAQFNTILNALQAEQITAGQIWSTQSYLELPDGRVFQTDDPRVVVVLESDWLGQK